jgi:hypothetical protein
VTFRLNIVRNIGAGFALASNPDNNYPCVHAARLTITNNILYTINTGAFTGTGRGFLVLGDLADVTLAHNTVITPTDAAIAMGPPATVRLTVGNNIVGAGAYGIIGDNYASGTSTWAAYAPSGTLADNVIIGADPSSYPANNFYPASTSAVGFVNATAFDFHLSASSPYRGKATDGTDPGANIDAVNAATQNVVLP